jgi:hypothetical protein
MWWKKVLIIELKPNFFDRFYSPLKTDCHQKNAGTDAESSGCKRKNDVFLSTKNGLLSTCCIINFGRLVPFLAGRVYCLICDRLVPFFGIILSVLSTVMLRRQKTAVRSHSWTIRRSLNRPTKLDHIPRNCSNLRSYPKPSNRLCSRVKKLPFEGNLGPSLDP